jgi:elongation factor P
MILATQIRVGMILLLEKELWRVTYMMHVTPGKGVACVQTKLKNVITGKNLEQRFRSNDKVEKASLDHRKMQFLFAEPTGFVFMDQESYEQMALTQELVDGQSQYFQEGTDYDVVFFEGTPVGLELPLTIDLEVDYAPPEIKKATATNSLRPVRLVNGMEVNAPGFVKTGDVIRVNTETNEYLERVK